MRLPWRRPEARASGGDFTDAVVRLIEAQAAGAAADASSTAAVEAAAGTLSRAFAAAEVTGPDWATSAVSPMFLAQVGRDLIRSGASLHVDPRHGRPCAPPTGGVVAFRGRPRSR